MSSWLINSKQVMRVEIYINSRHRIIYLRESENELINSIKVKLKNLIWKRKNKNKVTSLSKRKKTSFYVIHVRVDSAYELYGQRHFNVHNLWMLSAAEIQQGKGGWCLRGDGHRDVLIWFHIYLVFTLFINVLFSGFVFGLCFFVTGDIHMHFRNGYTCTLPLI